MGAPSQTSRPARRPRRGRPPAGAHRHRRRRAARRRGGPGRGPGAVHAGADDAPAARRAGGRRAARRRGRARGARALPRARPARASGVRRRRRRAGARCSGRRAATCWPFPLAAAVTGALAAPAPRACFARRCWPAAARHGGDPRRRRGAARAARRRTRPPRSAWASCPSSPATCSRSGSPPALILGLRSRVRGRRLTDPTPRPAPAVPSFGRSAPSSRSTCWASCSSRSCSCRSRSS